MLLCKTPLRVSFAGGGTDFAGYYSESPLGGAVVSMAIARYIYILVKGRYDQQLCLSYRKKEYADQLDDLQHALIREALRRTGVTQGVEVSVVSDISGAGSGLGSSSTLTVGLLNALYHYTGKQVPAEQLARDACKIEIDLLGAPIGKQDQYAAAYGGLRYYEFHPDGRVSQEDLGRTLSMSSLIELHQRLLLFNTGISRSANTVLAEQAQAIPVQRRRLDDLRDQAVRLREGLLQGNLHQLSQTLMEGWLEKRKLAGGISNPELDALIQKAQLAGAGGAKITGAGGGGHLLLYCHPGQQERVREALKDLQEVPVLLDGLGSRIIFRE